MQTLIDVFLSIKKKKLNILEVGSSSGERLKYIHDNYGHNVTGIEPSDLAIKKGKKNKIKILKGSSDYLPFKNKFDIIIYGFCLYLTDKKLLKISFNEADKALKKEGWIIIHDFYSKKPKKVTYHHNRSLYSYKNDYAKIFLKLHKNYNEYFRKIFDFNTKKYSDDKKNWEIISILKKQK